MPTKFPQNNIVRAAGAFTRNFITTEAKEYILSRNLMINGLSPAALSAINEGTTDISENLFGLAIWDVIQLRYVANGISFFVNLNIAQVEVTQSRNIIQTPVQGLDGTIKEFISAGDNQIKIRATIVGDAPDFYPGAEVQSIKETLDVKTPINIISTILNKYFNISSVVVTDYSFSQPEVGMRNVQSVEISAVTDDPSVYQVIMTA